MNVKTQAPHRDAPPPTLKSALVFRAKATALQLKRAARNALDQSIVRFPPSQNLSNAAVISESTSRLWTDAGDAETLLLAGKVHNLRRAIRQLNGVVIPAGSVFSFWAHVGRTTRGKGYVRGRELREGCIVPAVGGGICQLSNALYDAALRAGLEIIERHAHTQVIPGSLAELGRDATVFWNYVDLRFRSPHNFRIEVVMNADSLTVRLKGDVNEKPRRAALVVPANLSAPSSSSPQNCFSCGVHECFRHVAQSDKNATTGRSAYLVDEYWPEFDKYLSETKREEDLLLVPLDGRRIRKANYAWTIDNFRHVKQSWRVTLLRAYGVRKLAAQGAARQRALLAFDERLAQSQASELTYDVTHLVVMQNLLPYLWRDGHLGGRTFDVLMTALPLSNLHERLNLAAARHPECRTLADFRADESLVRAEDEALRQARKIVTPHSEIAALFKGKAVTLDWDKPAPRSLLKADTVRHSRIVFPASTVGRKGAYELRAAIQGLDVQLRIFGSQLEGDNFWRGISIERAQGGENWLDGVDALVLPAYVEHKPRRLLAALASGIPVIASTACGLENTPGVINIEAGDATALRREIEKLN